MTQVKPSDYIIGLILFMLVVLGGIGMINEFRGHDASFVDEDKYDQFNRSFNQMDKLEGNVTALKDNIVEDNPDFGAFSVLGSVIQVGWNSLVLLLDSFSFMDDVFNGISEIFGIPAFVSTLLILLVIIIIVFAIFSAIFQREV